MQPASILIVDDLDANLLVLESVLDPLGHRLVRAKSGEEALRHAAAEEFAVILLDVMMPGIDGFETARRLREGGPSKSAPIIFVSAVLKSAGDVLHGYSRGAVDYLVKPFEPAILRAKVEIFVELWQSREEIRRQTAALARAQETAATFRFLAESIPQQVWTASPDGALDYVNSVVLSYFAQSMAEVLGAGWQAFIHPEDLPPCVERWTASVTTGRDYEVEFRLRRHDGNYRWHLGRAVADRDGSGTITRWFGTNTDVHDQRSAQENEAARLAAVAEREYQALRADVGAALTLQTTLDAILRDTCDALVRRLGVAFARVWTLNLDTLVLELQASAGLYTHIDGPHARVPVGKFKIGRIAAEVQPHLTNDVAHDPWVGYSAWAAANEMVAFAGFPLVSDGKCVGVVAMFSRSTMTESALGAVGDVAAALAQGIERKRAEQALEERAQELARSNAELERFAYVASHDLQEPLRMVASYTQLLGRRYKGKLDASADEFIAFAVDGANRMQALINDLLAFSRVGRGAKSARITLDQPLATALANLKVAIDESGAVVTHDPLPELTVDPVAMVQLFQNLIGNAIKFRGSEAPRVHVSAHQEGVEQRISVRDNGIGIAPEFFDRLFVVFQRLHTRSEYPGNGIGLAICKKIVERHGGRIWVEPPSGQGTTFTFTLKGSE